MYDPIVLKRVENVLSSQVRDMALEKTEAHFAQLSRSQRHEHEMAVLNTEIYLDFIGCVQSQVTVDQSFEVHEFEEIEPRGECDAMSKFDKAADMLGTDRYGIVYKFKPFAYPTANIDLDGYIFPGLPETLFFKNDQGVFGDGGSDDDVHYLDKSRNRDVDIMPNPEAKSVDYYDTSLDHGVLPKATVQALRKTGPIKFDDLVDCIVDRRYGDVDDRMKVESILEDLALFGIAVRYEDQTGDFIYVLMEE